MQTRIIEIIEIGNAKSLIQRDSQPVSELIETTNLIIELNNQLFKDSFILVSEQEPPHDVKLLVESPAGVKYLTSWRSAYNIFCCQNKGESSYDWKYKII